MAGKQHDEDIADLRESSTQNASELEDRDINTIALTNS